MRLPTDEGAFRIAMAVLLVGAVLVTGYHRLAARAKGGGFSRAHEPLWILVPLRLLGVAMFVLMGLCFARPAWLAWAFAPVPPVVRWIGAVGGLFAVMLVAWTLRSLGKNLTDTVGTRSDSTLVTHGPYGYIRHPFYTSTFLLLGSMVLLTACWLLGVAGVALLALLVVRSPLEEAKLVERFGDEYRNYAARTPRYWPSLFRTPDNLKRAARGDDRRAGLG